MSLFEETQPPKPLAERMRPRSLDDTLGQDDAKHMLSAFIEQGDMPSVVFFGPPGCGKTTFSRLMASLLGWEGRTLNAASASVKDIREMAAEAREIWRQLEKRTLLFIDEIHRLNKNQQDVLLPLVESGSIVLAGSTTENPFFALNQALRSRVQLIRLEPLSQETILHGLALACKEEGVEMSEDAAEWIAARVAGDLRMAFTVLESAVLVARGKNRPVSVEDAALCLSQTQVAGDRKGDNHYDLASAFQKSLRGSDADAAVYYLARFLETGEDPRFIARRLLVTASEDCAADPNALAAATHAFRAVEVLGMPECRLPLVQAVLYVARAPKSNQGLAALNAAAAFLKSRPLDPIPPHLRDAHYAGAAKLGHGKGYRYSHDFPDQPQTFLPENVKDQRFAAEPAKQESIDAESLARLRDLLRQEYGGEEWFELDADRIGARLDWPSAKVRKSINILVQDQKLTFKRMFKIKKQENV